MAVDINKNNKRPMAVDINNNKHPMAVDINNSNMRPMAVDINNNIKRPMAVDIKNNNIRPMAVVTTTYVQRLCSYINIGLRQMVVITITTADVHMGVVTTISPHYVQWLLLTSFLACPIL